MSLQLFVLGTDHLLASGCSRERYHVEPTLAWRLLSRLTGPDRPLRESAFLSTCARSELYGISRNPEDIRTFVLERLVGGRAPAPEEVDAHTRLRVGAEAVEHLFRTAAGLESAIQGEAQILGQVRRALETGRERSTLGPILGRCLEDAIRTGRRVRSETAIGRGTTSLAAAAVTRVVEGIGDPARGSALVLGCGETGSLLARLLRSAGLGTILLSNRTHERAESLAAEIGGVTVPLSERVDALARVDAVFAAVTTPVPLIGPEETARLESRSVPGPRWWVDLSHPRAFAQEVADGAGRVLVDLDVLHDQVQAARDSRRREVPRAELLVNAAVEEFLTWRRHRPGVPVLVAMRRQVLSQAMDEAERLAAGRAPEDRAELRRFARSLARTLLHRPTTALREVDPSTPGGRSVLEATASLFGLDLDLPFSSSESP